MNENTGQSNPNADEGIPQSRIKNAEPAGESQGDSGHWARVDIGVLFALLIVLVLIACPVIVLAAVPNLFNSLVQMIFGVLLAVASVGCGYVISRGAEAKQAAEKWLPAAQAACNELLTMRADAKKMMADQVKACEHAKQAVTTFAHDNIDVITNHMQLTCDTTLSNIQFVTRHIENAYHIWRIFIESNCERQQCERIWERLTRRQWELEEAIAP